MTRPHEVLRWKMWKRDPSHAEGMTFLAASPGKKFATADEFADWSRGKITDRVTDLRILAIGYDVRGRLVKVVTDHPGPARQVAA